MGLETEATDVAGVCAESGTMGSASDTMSDATAARGRMMSLCDEEE